MFCSFCVLCDSSFFFPIGFNTHFITKQSQEGKQNRAILKYNYQGCTIIIVHICHYIGKEGILVIVHKYNCTITSNGMKLSEC